ncbi:MAG: type III PLP-dependent enzyme [Archangium sp.]|nr:type III PLP-dependent enzyme [Archangium sp.]
MTQYEKAQALVEVLGERHGDEFALGGIAASAIAEQVGTPFFAYAGDALTARLRRVKKTLGPEVELFFSLKANPSLGLCQLIAQEGLGAELASVGELRLAQRAGFSPRRAIFAGPGKSDQELREAIEWGLESINVESEGELLRVAAAAARSHKTARVSLRVNPLSQVKGAQMRMAGGHTQFGIDEEQLEGVLARVGRHPGIHVAGVHVYVGSQVADVEALLAHCRVVIELAARVAGHSGTPLETIDFGGGFAVPYFEGAPEFDLEAFARGFQVIVEEGRRRLGPFRPIIELGRYLIAECGVYVTRVLDVKQSRGRTYAVTDGGMNHHITATGNFGQVFRKPYPMLVLNRLQQPRDASITVVGPCCTPLDVLGHDTELPNVSRGDLIGVFYSGAYGYSASSLNFLSHPTPAEALVLGGELHVLREGGAADQVLAGQRALPDRSTDTRKAG